MFAREFNSKTGRDKNPKLDFTKGKRNGSQGDTNVSVTREEVNCILILNSDRTQEEKKEAVRVFLVGRELTDTEIAKVLDDLNSYSNY